MSDELECFRKAAELGCIDIGHNKCSGAVYLWQREQDQVAEKIKYGNATYSLPHPEPRINRYAAAVCAEWWRRFSEQPPYTLGRLADCEQMIEQARAFGKRYGGA